MRRLIAAALAALALLCPGLAWATIGSVVYVGGAQSGTSTTDLTVTYSGGAMSVGDVYVIFIGGASIGSYSVESSVGAGNSQDSAGNTCTSVPGGQVNTAGPPDSVTSLRQRLYYCKVTTATTTSTTINVHSSATNRLMAAAIKVSGLSSTSPYVSDGGQGASANSGTSLSLTTPTLTASNQIVIALAYQGGSSGTFTEGAGFTAPTGTGLTFPLTNVSNFRLYMSYLITGPGSAVTYAPSYATAQLWETNYIILQEDPPAASSVDQMALMGVCC